jgi:uncharacterized protein (DUF779 family)
MYSGPEPWDIANMQLDPGHDDYFGENVPAGCPNLQNSPYLTRDAYKQLTVTPSAGGSVRFDDQTCTSVRPCKVALRTRLQVSLTAKPHSGYSFGSWGGACSGRTPMCSVTMSDDQNVTAAFAKGRTSRLTVLKKGTGSGIVNIPGCALKKARCTMSVASGKSVTLKALPGKKSKFVRWGGACKGTKPMCKVKVIRPLLVTVTFDKK